MLLMFYLQKAKPERVSYLAKVMVTYSLHCEVDGKKVINQFDKSMQRTIIVVVVKNSFM